MKWTIEKVRKAFGAKLLGNLFMRKIVCETVLLLPDGLIEEVTSNVWFISSPDDAWAFTLRGSDVRNRHLVILSDELLKQDEYQTRYTILHEIGHVVLDHENSVGRMQTQTEIKRQEMEADLFAKRYLV